MNRCVFVAVDEEVSIKGQDELIPSRTGTGGTHGLAYPTVNAGGCKGNCKAPIFEDHDEEVQVSSSQ